jgi:hypothetical protein
MGSFDVKKRHKKSHAWAPLTQPVQYFFMVQFQVLTTSGLTAAGPQSRNILAA